MFLHDARLSHKSNLCGLFFYCLINFLLYYFLFNFFFPPNNITFLYDKMNGPRYATTLADSKTSPMMLS